MDINDLTGLHFLYGFIKALDHLAGTADKLQRLSPVIGRIKLRSVIKRDLIMDTALLIHVAHRKLHFFIIPWGEYAYHYTIEWD